MVQELCEKVNEKDTETDEKEQRERGKRIKNIREEQLNMNKAELGRKIGISGQFLGLVEEGKGNLSYRSVKKLMKLSGHSSDYILYGLDDSVISDTKKLLQKYNQEEIMKAMNILQEIAMFISE